ASPIFVHLFMILGVALYTLFGAVVMRSLESKTIEPSQRDKRFILSDLNISNSQPQNHSRDHEIRHFSTLANGSKTINDLLKDSNNTAIISGNSRTRRELAHVMRSRRCVLTALQVYFFL
uniref:Uncharacterized protein n=1 Tax=Panagrolaimus sp. PS1159 TaxID=55785 RepID=A0AC35FCD7_9BILA